MNGIVKFLVRRILSGAMTTDELPALFRADVESGLEDLGYISNDESVTDDAEA